MSLTGSNVEDAAPTWFLLRRSYGGQVGELGNAVGHEPRMVKRILNKYGYPPDLREEAVKTVPAQAELLCADWA
jgi:hypothetical protein